MDEYRMGRGLAEQRIDVLAGDRCCAKCSFNLHGQTIVREPHYGLLMVRCPECGTGAAMQEYPTLTRWAGRVRALLAAGWILLVLGCLALTGTILYGLTTVTMETVIGPYSRSVNEAWGRWAEANLTQAQRNSWWSNSQQAQTWWSSLPPDGFFREFGGWRSLNWFGMLTWIFVAASMVAIGLIGSVGLPRLRARPMLLVIAIPVLFALALIGDDMVVSSGRWYSGLDTMVRRQVGWPPALMTLAFGGLCLMIGTRIGRPLTRLFLSLALPPRMLAVFSYLWVVDGKGLPSVRLASSQALVADEPRTK